MQTYINQFTLILSDPVCDLTNPNLSKVILTNSQWLRCWISNIGVPCSKPMCGSEVDSVFHPSEVNKMSTRNLWELSGKK